MMKKYPGILTKSTVIIGALILAVVMTNCSKSKKSETKQSTPTGRTVKLVRNLYFVSANGDTLSRLRIAIADTPKERDTGLMNVYHLPQDAGMLFIFHKVQPLSFWMANTPLPLDIIFINKDKKVMRIYHSTQPFSEKNLDSDGPALYVVETNGGYCINHDITEGVRVSF